MTTGKPEIRHDVPIRKFVRLLDYLEKVGIDSNNAARRNGLSLQKLKQEDPNTCLPGYRYSDLYEIAAEELQKLDAGLPWGAGIGSDVFRFMCYSIISCRTLNEVIQRAERYYNMLQPLTGYSIRLNIEGESATLEYLFDPSSINKQFLPEQWDRVENSETVAKSSGLRVWHALLGWLVGREIELEEITISATAFSDTYTESLSKQMGADVVYDAKKTMMRFPASCLQFKTVHTPESLEAFLRNAVFSLIAQDSRPVTSSSAILSLFSISSHGSLPSFEDMAENLHMSPSSLRRRLTDEGTSYQQLKDSYRRDVALRYLRTSDLKINQIGELLGFLETSSFIRSFKGWTGLTPKQYRSSLSDS